MLYGEVGSSEKRKLVLVETGLPAAPVHSPPCPVPTHHCSVFFLSPKTETHHHEPIENMSVLKFPQEGG